MENKYYSLTLTNKYLITIKCGGPELGSLDVATAYYDEFMQDGEHFVRDDANLNEYYASGAFLIEPMTEEEYKYAKRFLNKEE